MGSGVGLFHQLVCLADGSLDVTLKTEPFAGVKCAGRSKVLYFLRVIIANPNHPLQVLFTAAHAVFFIVVNADDGVRHGLYSLKSALTYQVKAMFLNRDVILRVTLNGDPFFRCARAIPDHWLCSLFADKPLNYCAAVVGLKNANV